MRYLHGAYTFGVGEVELISMRRTMIDSPRGDSAVFRVRMDLRGEIKADTQSAIRSRIQEIKIAFAIPVGSTGFLHTDGSASAHFLQSFGTMTGIKVPVRPSFPASSGSEYATHRSFYFSVFADKKTGIEDLWDFQESLLFAGNCGPRIVAVELDTGDPDFQQVSEKTTQQIIQTGFAVGVNSYPAPAAKIYSDSSTLALMNPSESVVYVSPVKVGIESIRYRTTWNYRYITSVPQNGLPHES